MGVTERRAKAREAVRSEIVDAARQIVLKEGYRALTMRRIAEAVEFSPAAIYQYFENRDAIALEIMERGFAEMLVAMQPALQIAEPRARLAAIGHAYVRFGLEHPALYRLMFMEDPEVTATLLERPQDPNAPGPQAYGAIIEPFAQLAAQGRLRADTSVQAAADTVWVAVHGIVSLKLTCPQFPATPVEPLAHATIEALLDGLLTRDASQ